MVSNHFLMVGQKLSTGRFFLASAAAFATAINFCMSMLFMVMVVGWWVDAWLVGGGW